MKGLDEMTADEKDELRKSLARSMGAIKHKTLALLEKMKTEMKLGQMVDKLDVEELTRLTKDWLETRRAFSVVSGNTHYPKTTIEVE